MPCQGIPKNPFPTVTTNETDKFRYEICLFLIVLNSLLYTDTKIS